MRKLLTVLILAASTIALQGCATFTIATVGGLVAAGAIVGAGRFAGERIASRTYRNHITWRKCQMHRNNPHHLEWCIRRYM